jgi:hypothetical protein
MSKLLQLSASQISTIHQAARNYDGWDQTLFLRCVSDQLRQEPEIGDGTVHRCVRAAQKQFFIPPLRT